MNVAQRVLVLGRPGLTRDDAELSAPTDRGGGGIKRGRVPRQEGRVDERGDWGPSYSLRLVLLFVNS
jgi:hypothetical protein